MKTASWVLRNKTTKEVICETFSAKAVEALNTEKYEAVPILDYLVALNQSIKLGTTADGHTVRALPDGTLAIRTGKGD